MRVAASSTSCCSFKDTRSQRGVTIVEVMLGLRHLHFHPSSLYCDLLGQSMPRCTPPARTLRGHSHLLQGPESHDRCTRPLWCQDKRRGHDIQDCMCEACRSRVSLFVQLGLRKREVGICLRQELELWSCRICNGSTFDVSIRHE